MQTQSVVPSTDRRKLRSCVQVVQNVVVELQYKEPNSAAEGSNGISRRSVYAGWTGMASAAKVASIGERTGRRPKEEIGVVEIDATFGRVLGLTDGQRVGTFLKSKKGS